MEQKKTGFIRPVRKPDHWVFGASQLPQIILRSDGQWIDYEATEENQFNSYFDTDNCSGFGTGHAIEFIYRFLGQAQDVSKRFIGIMAGTTAQGNDPHTVAESVRVNGLIPDSVLPFESTLTSAVEYYNFDNSYQKDPIIQEGKNWLIANSFNHEWVYTDDMNLTVAEKQTLMKQALQYSPLGVSVLAWQERNGMYYKDPGQQDCHWTVVMGYVDGQYWKVFDSYSPYEKLLEWGYDFEFCKKYSITQAAVPQLQQEITWFTSLKNLYQQLLAKLQKPLGGLSKITIANELTTLTNELLEIKSLINKPMEQTPSMTKISNFCLAIQAHEGYYVGSRSYRDKNPGNLRYIGQRLATGKDAEGFCIFATYEDGFQTLEAMIKNAASGVSEIYNPSDTILQFFEKYAPTSDNNNPSVYAEAVAAKVGVPVTTQLSELLS